MFTLEKSKLLWITRPSDSAIIKIQSCLSPSDPKKFCLFTRCLEILEDQASCAPNVHLIFGRLCPVCLIIIQTNHFGVRSSSYT
ncbi:unnamed protein product [Arabis nemorensis]|uniref:Uncharacterized protein n=1 Tax=Arabis nemorensis TaxID=586526 RepID=A0A565C4J4_9BRAS|nr:unnamed protein product [Arabis nemorensis]